MPLTKLLVYQKQCFNTCLNLCQCKVRNVEKAILYEKEHVVHPCQKKKKTNWQNTDSEKHLEYPANTF